VKARVFLLHWHAREAEERALRLRDLGFAVEHESGVDGEAGRHLRSLGQGAIDAVIVDLSRLPSHGRAFAGWLRQNKRTRRLPLLFLAGDAEKTARVRAAFPDAVFTDWRSVARAVARAIAAPPAAPVVPATPDYSGTPLLQKLGIREGSRVLLLSAPRGFRRVLGKLPAKSRVATRAGGKAAVILLFCKSLADLQRKFAGAMRCLGEGGGLWIAWPKKTANVPTDLDENKVRATGLGHGLVDNKVCAIDATWSGLRFARRRPRR
jgi:CheY-like chemotaxis protein